MTLDLPAVSLVCPRCRARGPNPHATPLSLHGCVWVCNRPSCDARYPALPFPAVLRDLSAIAQPVSLVPWHRMDIDAAIAWLESMGSDSMAASAARRIATYVWSHFRDRMPAELTPSFIGDAPLPVLLAQLAGGPCQTALVMGIGAVLFSMSPSLGLYVLIPTPLVITAAVLYYRYMRPHFER
ncbi:MAG TPA: hypothetical protein PLI95_18865, partial [Polyangiaceae bacterium]|nr:hypothetical protein [Polyangiaceae bacterium]